MSYNGVADYPICILKVPNECDGCGNMFTFQHALDCGKVDYLLSDTM